MTDIVDPTTRSRMMAGIRGRDTRPEVTLRQAIFARGLRFRLHRPNLPGRPDLVFPRWHAVIFVHGCFWHQHPGCRFATRPASNVQFWSQKLASNVLRDAHQIEALRSLGWRVGIVWECEIRADLEAVAERVAHWLRDPTMPPGLPDVPRAGGGSH